MAKLEILHFPDERLRTVAKPVERVTPLIKQLVNDMFETMYEAQGVGLAATQVDVHQRIITIDISPERNLPLVLINPEITATEGEQQYDEGCLSVPGSYETVTRAATIKVAALDREGQPFTLTAEGLLAICIQHECDHLQGRLFVDYLSKLKRNRIQKRLLKQSKQLA
ncbi:peptide deformylase [Ectothiorhodospiraceae bacterium BW-2]|nr:peptide deformylase [Ectothiorhodospiraceae bacterium BW-2]